MSSLDADRPSYTRCLHGKRPCHQRDVNRRSIQSVTVEMTDDCKEILFTSILNKNDILSPSMNTDAYRLSKKKKNNLLGSIQVTKQLHRSTHRHNFKIKDNSD